MFIPSNLILQAGLDPENKGLKTPFLFSAMAIRESKKLMYVYSS